MMYWMVFQGERQDKGMNETISYFTHWFFGKQ